MSVAERQELPAVFDDLARDTPRTGIAILRLKSILSKVVGNEAATLRVVVRQIATEAVKQELHL